MRSRDVVGAHGDESQLAGGAQRQHALETFRVGEQEFEAAVVDAVRELLARPPRVHRHRHGADRRDAHEREQPLGIVARRDADAIALFDAGVDQPMCDARRLPPRFVERVALVLINVEVFVGVHEARPIQLAQVRRRVLEYAERHAVDRLRNDLVRLTGGGNPRGRRSNGFDDHRCCLA